MTQKKEEKKPDNFHRKQFSKTTKLIWGLGSQEGRLASSLRWCPSAWERRPDPAAGSGDAAAAAAAGSGCRMMRSERHGRGFERSLGTQCEVPLRYRHTIYSCTHNKPQIVLLGPMSIAELFKA